MGFCCIAPILPAKIFGTKNGGPGMTLTLGKKGEDWPIGDVSGIIE